MIQNEITVKLFKGRKRCFYCGKGWIVLRWTITDTGLGPGHGYQSYIRQENRWVCLHHTRRFFKEA